MEQIIIYITTFLIGTMFGSFFTLAIYRIPLHENITHKHSFCPKCNNKLSFLDLIPIVSYIALGGKCRYCKQKIRPRYVILEILTGFTFLLFVASFNITFPIENSILIELIFGILYIAGLIIIAGIDKEKVQIPLSVLLYEILVLTAYIIYMYILKEVNIVRYAIYLVMVLIMLLINIKLFKKQLKNNYTIQILILCILMASFSSEMTFIYTVIITLFSIAMKNVICGIQNMKRHVIKIQKTKIPFAFYLCICNLIIIILANGISTWVMK